MALFILAKATLSSAVIAEKLIHSANLISEYYPILTRIYDRLHVASRYQERIQDLKYLIAAELDILRKSKLVGHFIEMARITADALKDIPLPNDPTTVETATVLAEETAHLHVPTIPLTTEIATQSSTSSSTTSTPSTAPTADDNTTLQKDVERFRRFLSTLEPPTRPTILRMPPTFHTTHPEQTANLNYHTRIIKTAYEISPTITSTYRKTPIEIAPYGPSHRPIFLAQSNQGHVVWASTKRKLMEAIVEMNYEGLTDEEDN